MRHDAERQWPVGVVPALFLHIQKTAGTSIVDLARRHYGSSSVTSHGDHLKGIDGTSSNKILFSPENIKARFGRVAFVSGHFGYDFSRVLMDGRYAFTFLRDPAERILSFYYFCKTRDPNEFDIYKLSQEVSLDAFLEMGFEVPSVKACIWNAQAWQLAHGYSNTDGRYILQFTPDQILELATNHLNDFSYIGFAERFEHDRNNILCDLGIDLPKRKIVSNANPGRPGVRDLPSSTAKLLDELTELDRTLYKEAMALQGVRLSRDGRDVKDARLNKRSRLRFSGIGKSIKTWLMS